MSSTPPSTKDPFQLAGTTIEGKYRVASVVGDGGFGVVYRGVHKGFGELIAIKCLKLPQELDDAAREAFLEQLREEGRLLHRLSRSTPGIVQALDVGAFTTPQGTWVPYLVLEWLEGETLADLLIKRRERGDAPMPIAEAIRLLDPAVRALAIAHQQKIAHRDVKPPNLFVALVGGQKTLKVLDFGIAKVLTEHPSFTEQLAATKAGPTAFTPRYGAPEQFNKQRGASGPWTDVFALALIFVELVTGKKALEGDDPTQLYIASADPQLRPTPRARGAEVTDAVEAVLERALRIEPKYRFPDAGEFWNALLDAAGETTALGAIARGSSLPPRESGATLETKPPSGDPTKKDTAHQPTLPAESLAVAKTRSEGAPAERTAADDPMSETPLLVRAPEAAASRSSTTAKAEKPSSRAWPWALVAVLIGGGAGLAYLRSTEPGPPDPKPKSSSSAHASTAPKHSATPLASTKPSASAAPVTSASASVDAGPAALDGMVLFAKGSFELGEPPRAVTLSRGFYLDKREASARDYLACVAARKCGAAAKVTPLEAGDDAGDARDYVEVWSKSCTGTSEVVQRDGARERPINCVDFTNAESFCRWKGKRLPTEAEWELAARGRDTRRYPWGDAAPDCKRACFDRNSGPCQPRGEPVGTCVFSEAPGDVTPEGVEGLGGSVAEWVLDGFASKPASGADPKGDPAAALRVARGGSFLDGEEHLRAGYRAGFPPVTAHVAIGFRCALDAAP